MKKLLFGLLVTVMLSITGNAQDLSKLSQDANFKLFLKNQFEFSKRSTDYNKVKELISDGKVDEGELKDFYRVFSTTESGFSNFIKEQKSLYIILINEYNLDEIPQDVLLPIIEEVVIKDLMPVVIEGKNCMAKYLTTIAIAAGVAAAGHHACNLGALAGPVGFFGCHAAVIVVQSGTSYLAQLHYEDCMEN